MHRIGRLVRYSRPGYDMAGKIRLNTMPERLKGLSSENDIEGYLIENKCADFEIS